MKKEKRMVVCGRRHTLKALALLAVANFLSAQVIAQDRHWNGGASSLWNTTDLNWKPNDNLQGNSLRFVDGLNVVFNQRAILDEKDSVLVSLTSISAGNIQATNSSGTFTFSGFFGTLNATSLTVNGGGNVNLGSLPTTIGSGGVTVSNGSELTVGSQFLGADLGGLEADSISATGTFIQGSGTTQGNTNASGTIILGANNGISDTASITLGGGTLRTNGFNEGSSTTVGLGALTLTADSILDFSSSNGLLHFSGFDPGSSTLQIWNWDNSDRLYFSPQLDQAQLAQIVFYSDNGLNSLGSGAIGTSGIVPIPEPGTIFGAIALVGLVSWRERRRIGTALQALR